MAVQIYLARQATQTKKDYSAQKTAEAETFMV